MAARIVQFGRRTIQINVPLAIIYVFGTKEAIGALTHFSPEDWWYVVPVGYPLTEDIWSYEHLWRSEADGLLEKETPVGVQTLTQRMFSVHRVCNLQSTFLLRHVQSICASTMLGGHTPNTPRYPFSDSATNFQLLVEWSLIVFICIAFLLTLFMNEDETHVLLCIGLLLEFGIPQCVKLNQLLMTLRRPRNTLQYRSRHFSVGHYVTL